MTNSQRRHKGERCGQHTHPKLQAQLQFILGGRVSYKYILAYMLQEC